MPYHLIGIREVMGLEGQDSEKALLLYIMDRFTWEYYSPELNDFGNAFGSKTVFITRSCMAAALYFEVAWAEGRNGYSRSSGFDEQDPIEAWRKVSRKANKLERMPRG